MNAYLKDREPGDVSVEYAALALTNDYAIEPWTPVDSVAWLKAMAWDLRGNMQDEIDRSLLTSRLTPAQIKQLYPEYPYALHQPIVGGGKVDESTGKFDPKGGGEDDDLGTGETPGSNPTGSNGSDGSGSQGMSSQLSALSEVLDGVPALLGPNGNGIGSNSWVVAGSTRPPASRCSPTTRTSRRSSRPSGTRWACTAARSRPPAATTSPATPSPACPV